MYFYVNMYIFMWRLSIFLIKENRKKMRKIPGGLYFCGKTDCIFLYFFIVILAKGILLLRLGSICQLGQEQLLISPWQRNIKKAGEVTFR